jgi:hypothetical protein
MNKISLTLECEIDDVDLLLALYEILHYDKASLEERGKHTWSGATQENCDHLLFLVAQYALLVLGEREGDIDLALKYIRGELKDLLQD